MIDFLKNILDRVGFITFFRMTLPTFSKPNKKEESDVAMDKKIPSTGGNKENDDETMASS